jgi:UDP-3-O-[3-hydroxymyristoyl] glucosamine N-acyltransferase
VIVHANTTLGSDGFGYAQEKTSVGVNHVKIIHTGSLIIGDDVEIGANSSVDRGTIGDTVIGRGAKIDNQVQIGHNCQIGEGAIICGSCALGGSSKVGRYAVLAGFCAVANGAEIGDGAIIGGMSGVQGQIGPGKVMVGNPLRERSEFYRIQASMTSLPEIFKFWKRTRKEKKE